MSTENLKLLMIFVWFLICGIGMIMSTWLGFNGGGIAILGLIIMFGGAAVLFEIGREQNSSRPWE